MMLAFTTTNGGNMAKKRIGYFDIAKCIAILFIIVGHVGLLYNQTAPGGMPVKLVHLAFTFHLPVFFIASGYFFKLDTVLNKQFFKKAWNNIITPYWVTCVFIIVGCVAIAAIYGTSMKSELIRWTGAALYGAGATSSTMLIPVERIGGIWFLPALLWAQVIILTASRLPKPGLWIVGLFVVGWAASHSIQLPWSIQSGICAAPFVYAGALARKYQLIEKDGRIPSIATAVCAVIWLYYIICANYDMSFAVFALPNGFVDIIGSFAAAYVVFRACRFIEHHCAKLSKFMEWIGRNTLVIFCFHIVEDNVMVTIWLKLMAVLGAALPHAGWVVLLLIRLAVIALECGIIYLIPKVNEVYFPSKRKKAKPAVAAAKPAAEIAAAAATTTPTTATTTMPETVTAAATTTPETAAATNNAKTKPSETPER